mgnify:CR=1 FL=1
MTTRDLPAGRELDALVAEKVMGWKHYAPAAVQEVWYPPNLHPSNNVLGHSIPHYSTDIAVAWQVVEHLKNKLHLQVILHWAGDECPKWLCNLRADGYRSFQDQEWQVEADTAPLAICLAALKAVGWTND